MGRAGFWCCPPAPLPPTPHHGTKLRQVFLLPRWICVFETESHVARAGLKPDIFPKMTSNSWFSCFYLSSAGLQVVSPTSRYAVLGVLDRSSTNWATSLDPTWISEQSFFNCILFISCACLCGKLLNYIYLVYAFVCMYVCVVCKHTYVLASVWRSENQHVGVISLLTLHTMWVPD